jgi:hypothetical protein
MQITTTKCRWCAATLPDSSQRHHANTCSKKCRQQLWRFNVTPSPFGPATTPMSFAYADPPYPGKAHYYPEHQEVDHEKLIRSLQATYPDAWALSTSARSLRDILALCPETVRVCAWLRAARPHNHARIITTWEPLIIQLGRKRRRYQRDTTLDALIARGRFRAHPNAMVGMKPPAFAVWMFNLLGASPGDTFTDLFPGSGAVTRAWKLFCGPPATQTSLERRHHAD